MRRAWARREPVRSARPEPLRKGGPKRDGWGTPGIDAPYDLPGERRPAGGDATGGLRDAAYAYGQGRSSAMCLPTLAGLPYNAAAISRLSGQALARR